MATSKDVAKMAGVSHTTVSRAFRGDNSVKEATYEKVMKAARELGYFPNFTAANLKQQRTRVVGFINSWGFNPLFINIAKFMEQELQEHGYRLIISFDGENPSRRQGSLRTMISAQSESIIFSPCDDERESFLHEFGWMLNSKVHFVQLASSSLEGVCSFTFDDDYGALIGTRYLLANGHRRILLIGGNNRLKGYYQAYHELGIECPIQYTDLTGTTKEESRNNISNAIKLYSPTAIFSVAEPLNEITYEVLRDMEINVPSDMSLLAFDDEFWLHITGISAIGHPAYDVAHAIVLQILDCCENKTTANTSIHTAFEPFLIKRNSVADISIKNLQEKEEK